jgi:hypothetical protein
MDSNHLTNTIFWNEPPAVIEENTKFFLRQQTAYAMLNYTMERVNKRGSNGSNEISTSQYFQQIFEIIYKLASV